MTSADFAYADPHAVVSDLLALLLPPERLTVDQWAERYRWLNNAGGGHVGLFSNAKTPYIVQPQRCLTDLMFTTVAVVGPGQVAKTVIAENWLAYSIAADPAKFLWYMQTDDGIEAYVKDRINNLIDDHEILHSRLGTRSVDNSLHYKKFVGMAVEFLSATLKALISKGAPRIVADEIDNWEFLGDPKVLLDVRRQTYGQQSTLLALSHADRATGMDPGKDWVAGISAIYADSDRRAWYWPCPHCGAHSSPFPCADRVMTLEYPVDAPLEVIEREAHLLCPVCSCEIQDHEREAMNLAAFQAHGGWVGRGQEISEGGEITGELEPHDTAGFWIVGAMSPFIMGGIGGLARARVKAEREYEISGEDSTLRQVIVKQWGFGYSRPRGVGSIDAQELVERCEPALKLNAIPAGVRFFTVAIDCQAAHFELLKRGWGEHGESWILDTKKLPADPATSSEDWDKALTEALAPIPLDDGSGRVMAPRAFGYDSHGQPGVTAQAYSAWTRWRRAKTEGATPRMMGRIGGRDAWTILPLRGANGLNAPRLQVTYPDTRRAANRRAGRGEVPVGTFNPNMFKDDLAGQLKTGDVGPGYVHFPSALKSRGDVHVWFEQLVAEHQVKPGRWGKITASARNEALDLMVMTHVMAHLHGLSRIDWDQPRSWCAPWDDNSLVTKTAVANGVPMVPANTDGAETATPRVAAAIRARASRLA